MIHILKTHPEYFLAVLEGRKTFECRYNDRNFQVGDELHLREYCPEAQSFTGEKITGILISYILDDFEGLKPGYVILGLTPCKARL